MAGTPFSKELEKRKPASGRTGGGARAVPQPGLPIILLRSGRPAGSAPPARLEGATAPPALDAVALEEFLHGGPAHRNAPPCERRAQLRDGEVRVVRQEAEQETALALDRRRRRAAGLPGSQMPPLALEPVPFAQRWTCR